MLPCRNLLRIRNRIQACVSGNFRLTSPAALEPGKTTMQLLSRFILAAVMTALGVVVFHFGLHLLLPLFAW